MVQRVMGAVTTESPNFPEEGYAFDTSSKEQCMCGSMVISDQQIKSRTKALPACTSENGSIISSNNEPQEERCEKLLSTLPASSVESTHRGLDGEILSQSQEDVQKPNLTENHSNSCESWSMEHAEADTACRSSDPGDSVHFMETSTTTTLTGNTVRTGGENTDLHLGFTDSSSILEHEDKVTMSEGNADPSLKVLSAEMNRPSADSSLHCPLVINLWDSFDNNESVASSKAYEAIPRENVFEQASEALGCDTSTGTSHISSFADFPEHKLPSHETSTTVVVSTDLDGWQRFDAEESEASGGVLGMSNRLEGFNQSIDEAPQKSLELWEQLLEDGLEVSAQCIPVPTALDNVEVGIDSSLFDGNQYWLASPGNPFIEGLERSSNFSEADGFVTNVNLVRSLSLHDYEVDAFPSSKDRLIQGDDIDKQKFPGTTYDTHEQNVGSHLNGSCSDGSKRIAKQRFPSFSDIRRPRGPSSLSSKDQEQVNQASNILHEDKGGGEKWEANFDLMVPAIHEGPRSSSLPREAGDSHRQASFSLYSGEAPVTSQSKLSGFLSPKLSPIVKKVVDRVRTVPDQVTNVAWQGKGRQDVEKKESKKWMWRCCICCSRGN